MLLKRAYIIFRYDKLVLLLYQLQDYIQIRSDLNAKLNTFRIN